MISVLITFINYAPIIQYTGHGDIYSDITEPGVKLYALILLFFENLFGCSNFLPKSRSSIDVIQRLYTLTQNCVNVKHPRGENEQTDTNILFVNRSPHPSLATVNIFFYISLVISGKAKEKKNLIPHRVPF